MDRTDFIAILSDLCGLEILFSGISLEDGAWIADLECTITGRRGCVVMAAHGYAEPVVDWTH